MSDQQRPEDARRASWDAGVLARLRASQTAAEAEHPVDAPAPTMDAAGHPPQEHPPHEHPSQEHRPEALQTRPPAPPDLDAVAPAVAPDGRDHPAYGRLSRRPGASRWARGRRAVRSLVASDDTPDRFTRAVQAVQAPVALPRRVAVLGARGGAGATTVAVMMARALSYLRNDRTLLAAGTADLGSLALRAGAGRERTLAAAAGLLAAEPTLPADRLAEVAEHVDADLWVVPTGSSDAGLLADTANRLGRLCAMTVVDAARSRAVVEQCDLHAAVLVAPATLDGVLSAAQLLAGPWGQLRPDQVHVVLDVLPGSPRREVRGLAARLGDHGHPTHRLPTDRYLAAGARIDLDLLAEPTQLALLELLADVVVSATGSRSEAAR